MKRLSNPTLGSFLVATAACLWATDTLFRYPLLKNGLPALWIVLLEHLLGVFFLLPVLFAKRQDIAKIKFLQWLALAFIGVGASAFATLLFTASFQYTSPTTSILLQKLQPVFVVCGARFFLKEKVTRKTIFWGMVAIFASVLISDLHWGDPWLEQLAHSRGSLYAITAAILWAISTLLGKSILHQVHPLLVTFWRLAFGFIGLSIFIFITISYFSPPQLGLPGTTQSLLMIATISCVSLIIYYFGMSQIDATRTTLMELFFPIASVAINFFAFSLRPTLLQLGGAILLISSATQVHLAQLNAQHQRRRLTKKESW